MAFYKIYPLKVPKGNWSYPNKINNNQFTVGRCGTKAILWKPNGNFQLLNLPGTSSEAISLNSSQNVVGTLDDQAFLWQQSTGVTTLLKGFNGQIANAIANGINDFNQITGTIPLLNTFRYVPALWNTANAIPINLFAGLKQRVGGLEGGHGNDINNHGLVVGDRRDAASPSFYQSYIWENNKYTTFLNQKNILDIPTYGLYAVNDLQKPQIVGHAQFVDPGSYFDLKPILYDTKTTLLQILAIPGEEGHANDINNNGDAVGTINTKFQGIGSVPLSAALWIFNGQVRINLNHPSVSDAHANGWQLVGAKSINNNGYIVGSGFLNGDKKTLLPWLLKPIIPVHRIPIEYMLPQALWPGEGYDKPPPRRWPLKFPFPIPSPNPFQIVGNGFTHLNNILISKNVKETINTMSDSNARKKIQAIADQTIREEMKKLKTILTNHSSPVKKDEKKDNMN